MDKEKHDEMMVRLVNLLTRGGTIDQDTVLIEIGKMFIEAYEAGHEAGYSEGYDEGYFNAEINPC